MTAPTHNLWSVGATLPDWVPDLLARLGPHFPTPAARMGLAIELARENVRQGTGGPFGAAVFNADGALVAPGVNRVVPARGSIWHAEMVALTLAQQRLGTHDLGAPGLSAHTLYTSTEPCAMCLGAIPWSGVRELVCGARGEDAEAIGMDEGSKPADWAAALVRRGIAVVRDIRRDDAAAVLRAYAAGGGPIYNGRQA